MKRSTWILGMGFGLAWSGCGSSATVSEERKRTAPDEDPEEIPEDEEEEVEGHTGPCSEAGTEILEMLNAFRSENGLPLIQVSPSLCEVAQAHVEDLARYQPYEQGTDCALQSWSEESGVGCCYLLDNSNPECMWDKPSQLTVYPTNGYESVVAGALSAAEAGTHFQETDVHRDVILEQAAWENVDWKAVGAAYQEGYATLWFGADPDPALK